MARWFWAAAFVASFIWLSASDSSLLSAVALVVSFFGVVFSGAFTRRRR